MRLLPKIITISWRVTADAVVLTLLYACSRYNTSHTDIKAQYSNQCTSLV